MQNIRLSKSKIISGLQCQKRLWLEVHQPELIVWGGASQALFNVGHAVGDVAQQQFPGGFLIEHQDNLGEAIRETSRLLKEDPAAPLYEATFSSGGVLVRADVFLRDRTGYRLVEVKASTSVKDYHLNDSAVQGWVIEQAGYPLAAVQVAHINNQFVYQGNENYEGLFVFEDVTEQIKGRKTLVPEWISLFMGMLKNDMPCIEVGDHCNDPFACPFIEFCQGDEITEYPVDILPRGGKVIQSLKDEGFEDLRDVPEGYLSNENHERVRRISVSGQAEIDLALGRFMKGLAYPRYYLDFETIQFPVPVWVGTRPYQQLPFQYSIHVEAVSGDVAHMEFLDLSGEAPMRLLAESLINDLGNTGPILVYSSFEKTRLKELSEMFPDLAVQIERLIDRLVDLLPLFRAHYYHPDMKGSWSIKAVLPTVAPELDYGNLTEVQDGGQAQQAYLEAIAPDTDKSRKDELRERMLEYCKTDTLAMVKLVKFFN